MDRDSVLEISICVYFFALMISLAREDLCICHLTGNCPFCLRSKDVISAFKVHKRYIVTSLNNIPSIKKEKSLMYDV